MKFFFSVLMACFFVLSVSAQAPAKPEHYTKAADSDPAAKAILDKLRKKYEAFQSLEAEFTLELELPEMPREVQRGKIARKGSQYSMELAGQGVVCDGKALYLIMHNNKEVQINNVPDPSEMDGSLLTPESLFTFYDQGKFVYQFVNEFTENGRLVQHIEFKPLDGNADYTKLRLVVDKNKNEIASVKAFARDGARYTFTINRMTPNKAFAANYFVFDKAKFPGYYVEDLRD